jgi:N-carbamoylputrescine amidase
MDRVEEGVRLQSFDLAAVGELRRTWGVFRDRRPELYGSLLTIDGKLRFSAT